MDKNFYTPEHIEAYLENRLSPNERGLFENEISKDPLAKNEIRLQKDIIESLKNHRKSELKNRLNNIEVSLTPNYYGGLKIAASIVASGLIGLGIYSYFNNSNSSAVNNNEIYINKPSSEKSKNNSIAGTNNGSSNNINAETLQNNSTNEISNPNLENNNETSINKAGSEKSKDNSVKRNSGNKNTAANKLKATTRGKQNTTAVVNNSKIKKAPSDIKNSNKEAANTEHSSPMFTENFGNHEQFEKDNNINLPDGKIAQIAETKSEIDISIDNSTNNKFHYKYYNNKLFLYGNFDSKTYEILELNTYKGKQVYLSYEKSYYELNSNQIEVAPLSKITDEKMLEDLKKLK